MNAPTSVADRRADDARYDAATIWLHWITAFLAAALWVLLGAAAFARCTKRLDRVER